MRRLLTDEFIKANESKLIEIWNMTTYANTVSSIDDVIEILTPTIINMFGCEHPSSYVDGTYVVFEYKIDNNNTIVVYANRGVYTEAVTNVDVLNYQDNYEPTMVREYDPSEIVAELLGL